MMSALSVKQALENNARGHEGSWSCMGDMAVGRHISSITSVDRGKHRVPLGDGCQDYKMRGNVQVF